MRPCAFVLSCGRSLVRLSSKSVHPSTRRNEHASVDTRRILNEVFNLQSFRPGQEKVVQTLLEGRSSAAIFPTGSGKSLCFQLPSVIFDGLTVVVAPLLALMRNQLVSLHGRGIEACMIASSQSREEVDVVYDDIERGRCKILYCSPERFGDRRFWTMLQSTKISLFVIDEAHCISEWGHNFRPDYLALPTIARDLNADRCLALTATATSRVVTDICSALDINPVDVVRTAIFRSNLLLRVTQVETHLQRQTYLAAAIRQRPVGPTIVYVTYQKTAETLAEYLHYSGINAKAYHAGLNTERREDLEAEFLRNELQVIVATIAFGMGVDKPDVRYIYHFNVSKSIESYTQETGRAGRDGRLSVCETLLCRNDLWSISSLLMKDLPETRNTVSFIRSVFDHEARKGAIVRVNLRDPRKLLSQKHISLAFARMRDWKLVREEKSVPSKMKVKIQNIVQSKTAAALEYMDISDDLRRLLGRYVGKRGALNIDLEKIWQDGWTTEVLLKCLDELERNDNFEVDGTGKITIYRVVQSFDPEEVGVKIVRHLRDYAARELKRTEDLFAVLESPRCLPRSIGEHFDSFMDEDCGRCGACLNRAEI